MLLKEREAGVYPISAFFFGRSAADVPLDTTIPICVTTIIYLMVGLKPDVGAFLLTMVVVLITCFTAASLGLLIGAACLNLKRAQSVATVVMLTLMLTGGFFVQNIPVWLSWIAYLSYIAYAWEGLIHIQLEGRIPECPATDDSCAMLTMGAVKFDTLGPQIGILLLMLVLGCCCGAAVGARPAVDCREPPDKNKDPIGYARWQRECERKRKATGAYGGEAIQLLRVLP